MIARRAPTDGSAKTRLVTVGTGCGVPRLERRGPCTLFAAGCTLVIDLGLGALHGLLDAGVSHREVDGVWLTHLHPDHVAELVPFLFAANYDEIPRTRPLELVGGPGLADFVQRLGSAHGHWLAPRGYDLTLRELTPGETLDVGGWKVTSAATGHLSSSLAYRFDGPGVSWSITGDTGPETGLGELARGSDLLLAEASLPPGGETPGHLTASQAGALARTAGVRRLILHHLYPASDAASPVREARSTFGGEVTVAHDGMELELGA